MSANESDPLNSTAASERWSGWQRAGVAVVLVLVPLLLVVLVLPPNYGRWWSHKKNWIAPAAAAIAAASMLAYLRPSPSFPRRFSTFPMILLGTSMLLICTIAWNTFFLRYVGAHDYQREAFRPTMRNPWSPIYGHYDNALTRIRTAPFVALSIVIAATWYGWARRRDVERKWNLASFATLMSLQVGLIISFALCEPWSSRVLSDSAGYGLFAEDLAQFVPADGGQIHNRDILREYVSRMPTLGQYGQHYPPGNLFLMNLQRDMGVRGLARGIVVLLTVLSAVPLYKLAREIGLDPAAVTAALLVYTASTGILIYCTLNTTSLLLLPAILALWVLLRALRRGSLTDAILLGLIVSVYLFFSFSASILGVLLVLTAVTGWLKGAFRAFDVVRTAVVSLLSLGAVIGLLYLTTRFNLVACFFAAIRNHHVQQGNSGFDDLQRYLFRSTGNVLGYVLSIAPLAILAIPAIWWSGRDLDRRVASSLFLATAVTLLFAGFSGLFYLETERIWIFLTPFFALAAGYEIARRSAVEGRPLVVAMALLMLAVSCTEEFFLIHYR